MTSHYVLYKSLKTLFIIVNSDIFRHVHVLFRRIQPYWGLLGTLCNSCIFRTLAYLGPEIYSELCQDTLWYIQNAVLICAIFRNVTYLRSEVYSEPIFNNDSYNDINFVCWIPAVVGRIL